MIWRKTFPGRFYNRMLRTFSKIIEKCKSEKPEILDNISSDGKLEENTEKLLIDLIKDLKNSLK